jgi:hypothetical protein
LPLLVVVVTGQVPEKGLERELGMEKELETGPERELHNLTLSL